jgi:hypothetical protein
MNKSDSGKLKRLISKKMDLFLLGALTLLIFLGTTFLSFMLGPLTFTSHHLLILNVLISYPHIMSSFYLFYGKEGNRDMYPVIAWILPAILIVLLYVAIFYSLDLLKILGQVGLVYFFYHFLMQSIGSSLWSMDDSTINRRELKRILTLCGFSIGIMGWISLHLNQVTGDVFDMPLPALPFPQWLEEVTIWVPSVLLLGTLFYLIKVSPSKGRFYFVISSFLPLLALYLWFSPKLIHSPLRFFVTTLHALQYFPFYYRTQKIKDHHPFVIFLLWGIFGILGGLLFMWIPGAIEKNFYDIPEGTTGRVVSGVAIFLNIHHYLVDGTLWSLKDEKNLKRLGLD